MDSKDTKKKELNGRVRELTERQKSLIAALFGEAEGNWREAMRIAGYADTTAIGEVLEPIKEEVINQANSYLASLAPKAVRKYNKLLDDPNTPGAPNLLRTVEGVLNRVGISEKKSDDISLKVPSGGLFILPAKDVQEFRRVEASSEEVED